MFRMTVLAISIWLVFSKPALAYVGPGLGLGTLGVIGGIILSVFIAIFAVAWYPIKRIIKKNRDDRKAEPAETEDS